jgi:type III secretory pathway component EscS
MQKLPPIWTVMLVLILLMGAMPLILAGIGAIIVLYVENFGTLQDLSLLDLGMRLRFLASFSYATIPAAAISTMIWVFAKPVIDRAQENPDDPKEAP